MLARAVQGTLLRMSLVEKDRFARLPQTAPDELTYPAEFHFRIIAEAQSCAETALKALVAAYRVTAPLATSQASATGRYQAFSVSVTMRSRDEMHAFDAAVKQVPGVRMLL